MAEISKEELDEINVLRTKLVTVVSDAGQTSLQIQMLQQDIVELNEKLGEQTKLFKALLKEEEALIKRLSDKYGVGDINYQTGEFTPET